MYESQIRWCATLFIQSFFFFFLEDFFFFCWWHLALGEWDGYSDLWVLFLWWVEHGLSAHWQSCQGKRICFCLSCFFPSERWLYTNDVRAPWPWKRVGKRIQEGTVGTSLWTKAIKDVSFFKLFILHWEITHLVKNLPAVQETQVWSLGREDPLEKEMATHSSILAWKILWTEEPGEWQWPGEPLVGKQADCSLPGSSVHVIS